MRLRAIAGFALGLALWPVLFMLVGIGFGAVWPDYRAAARVFFDTRDFGDFTFAMMLTNFAAFAITGLVCGWLAARVGGTRKPGIALALVCLAYGAVNHFYMLWGNLPDWYNLVVPWIMGGSIWLGAQLISTPRPTPI